MLRHAPGAIHLASLALVALLLLAGTAGAQPTLRVVPATSGFFDLLPGEAAELALEAVIDCDDLRPMLPDRPRFITYEAAVAAHSGILVNGPRSWQVPEGACPVQEEEVVVPTPFLLTATRSAPGEWPILLRFEAYLSGDGLRADSSAVELKTPIYVAYEGRVLARVPSAIIEVEGQATAAIFVQNGGNAPTRLSFNVSHPDARPPAAVELGSRHHGSDNTNATVELRFARSGAWDEQTVQVTVTGASVASGAPAPPVMVQLLFVERADGLERLVPVPFAALLLPLLACARRV